MSLIVEQPPSRKHKVILSADELEYYFSEAICEYMGIEPPRFFGENETFESLGCDAVDELELQVAIEEALEIRFPLDFTLHGLSIEEAFGCATSLVVAREDRDDLPEWWQSTDEEDDE